MIEELLALIQITDLERQCCPFLTFRHTVEPQEGQSGLSSPGQPAFEKC